jgi:hypothetical protein
MGFTKEQKGIIANASKGSQILITNIQAQLAPKGDPGPVTGSLIYELK